MKTYRIVMNKFVAAIEVKDGKVVEAAPIMRWSLGNSLENVTRWVTSKGGEIKELPILVRREDEKF